VSPPATTKTGFSNLGIRRFPGPNSIIVVSPASEPQTRRAVGKGLSGQVARRPGRSAQYLDMQLPCHGRLDPVITWWRLDLPRHRVLRPRWKGCGAARSDQPNCGYFRSIEVEFRTSEMRTGGPGCPVGLGAKGKRSVPLLSGQRVRLFEGGSSREGDRDFYYDGLPFGNQDEIIRLGAS